MNAKHIIQVLFFTILTVFANAQALPIVIDEDFSDWIDAQTYQDTENDGNNYDFISLSVSNDENYLYIRFDLAEEVLLNDENNIVLKIDTDNNPDTGYPINGIGAELAWFFDVGQTRYYNSPEGDTYYIEHFDIDFLASPTVSSTEFEIAIARNTYINGFDLFPEQTIKVVICDNTDVPEADYMPNNTEFFTYTFDDDTVLPEFELKYFDKQNSGHIRIMTYNTLFSGIIDPEKQDAFRRILQAANPDIITFNECWDAQPASISALLNDWISPPEGSWQCIEADNGNITCSIYPIIDTYRIYPGHRLTAALIDLPSEYETNLLSINAHLKCCGGSGNNAIRQDEADAFASFILDAKTPGGNFDLEENTPFVLSGDLNLVGYRQQLTTLTHGDIQDTFTYGEGAPLDWDNTPLNDLVSCHTDRNIAYTWRNYGSEYWPGRLDFTIFSDSELEVAHSYTINTSSMSSARLAEFNLEENDTDIASDHLPKVTDFIVNEYTNDTKEIPQKNEIQIIRSSESGIYLISSPKGKRIQSVLVFDNTGKLILQEKGISFINYKLDLSCFKHGLYIIKVQADSLTETFKVLY